jgi:hypothetical protein
LWKEALNTITLTPDSVIVNSLQNSFYYEMVFFFENIYTDLNGGTVVVVIVW